MNVLHAPLSGLIIIEPDVYHDERGLFSEVWSREKYAGMGISAPFVQDNISLSHQGVLRGLHFQNPSAQGKLVSVIAGQVFDVAVDLRKDSPTFGKWYGETLSAENARQLYLPPGFAHGFVVTSAMALFFYKCTERYNKQAEKTLLWNDPDIGIEWPVKSPRISEKDSRGRLLKDLRDEELFISGASRP